MIVNSKKHGYIIRATIAELCVYTNLHVLVGHQLAAVCNILRCVKSSTVKFLPGTGKFVITNNRTLEVTEHTNVDLHYKLWTWATEHDAWPTTAVTVYPSAIMYDYDHTDAVAV